MMLLTQEGLAVVTMTVWFMKVTTVLCVASFLTVTGTRANSKMSCTVAMVNTYLCKSWLWSISQFHWNRILSEKISHSSIGIGFSAKKLPQGKAEVIFRARMSRPRDYSRVCG